ncbi:hypothetical protein ACFS5N_16410 [Mucilaginibacter ximonensis]|uniref:Uncharacterized protein n=1 Tax=Mucilaginibacter ximonensis TaxID=538021 RepID=A0ABW5YGW3_9SPHI
MITAENLAAIEKEVQGYFPDAKVKNSTGANGINLAFTKQSLNASDVMDLATISTKHMLSLNVKRSGTGLSVHFN